MSNSSESESNPVVVKFEGLLREWLVEERGDRVDIDYQAIHLTGHVRVWLTRGGERKSVHLPREVSFAMYDIRRSQVDSHRGAWLWSHLWMEAADGVLHQESDWMRQPVIRKRPVGGADAAVELEYYPRDPEWIPEWMAIEVAAYREEEARERQETEAEQGAEEPSGGE